MTPTLDDIAALASKMEAATHPTCRGAASFDDLSRIAYEHILRRRPDPPETQR